MEAIRPPGSLQDEISNLADDGKVDLDSVALALSSSGTRASTEDVKNLLDSLGVTISEDGQKVDLASLLNVIGVIQKSLSTPAGSFTGAGSFTNSSGDWMDMLSNTPSSFPNSPGTIMADEDSDTDALRSKNTQLTMRLESLESKLSQSDNSQMELLERLRKQQDTVAAVQKQSSLVKKLEEEKRRLEDELETLKMNVRDAKDQIRELNRKENESAAERARLQQQIEARDKELSDMDKRMNALKSKVADDDEAAAKSIAKLRAAAETAEKQAQERIDQLVKEKEALEAKISDLVKVNQSFQTKQLQTEQALDEVRRKLKDTEAAAAASTPTTTPSKKKSSLASELEAAPAPAASPELEQKVQILEELKVLLESEKEDLTKKVQQLESEKSTLTTQISSFAQKQAQLDETIKSMSLQQTAVQTQTQVEQQQKLWEQEKQQLGVQFDKMIAKLQDEKSILEQNLLQAKQENDTLKAMRQTVIAAPPAVAPPPVPAKPIPLLDNGPEIIAELNDLRLIKASLEEEVRKLKDQLTLATLKAKSLKPRSNIYSDDLESQSADQPLINRRQKVQPGCCDCCTIC